MNHCYLTAQCSTLGDKPPNPSKKHHWICHFKLHMFAQSQPTKWRPVSGGQWDKCREEINRAVNEWKKRLMLGFGLGSASTEGRRCGEGTGGAGRSDIERRAERRGEQRRAEPDWESGSSCGVYRAGPRPALGF